MKGYQWVIVFGVLLLVIIDPGIVCSQIDVLFGDDVTPEEMVESILGEGIEYSDVNYTGSPLARGVFECNDSSNFELSEGIFLSSGKGESLVGPSSGYSTGWNLGIAGDSLLNTLSTSTTYDAAVLEFSIVAESKTLSLEFVFGSEEYHEFVNSSFDDVCGVFVSGPKPGWTGYYEYENIAVVPGFPDSAVCVNNINNGWAGGGFLPSGPCVNCEYLIDNLTGPAVELDAFTTVLTTTKLPVIPCQEYHIRIGVADAGSGTYDAAIFVRANSLKAAGVEVETMLQPPGLTENMVEGFVAADLVFHLPDTLYAPDTLYIDVDGTADPAGYPGGDFMDPVESYLIFGEGSSSATIHTEPFYDALIEGEETLRFIIANDLGCTLKFDTLVWIIEDYVSMFPTTCPDPVICAGQLVNLWIDIEYGYPPYSITWLPGEMTGNSVVVSPQESTTYYIYCTDLFTADTLVDSVQVTVMPANYEIAAFSFEPLNNPGLPWTVNGQVFEDSIALEVPTGTDLTSLVATWDIPEGSWIMVDGVVQENGITPNDFSEPLVYHVIAPGGCSKEWTITVNLVTGTLGPQTEEITIHPNPASDQLVMMHAEGYELIILNGLGKKVLQRLLKSNRDVIQTNDLKEGIYFLKIGNNHESITRKLIIKR